MSLRVWLPLDGNLKNLGISNLTVINYGATINTAGKIGQCYSFDGTDDYILLKDTVLYDIIQGGAHPFSIAMWVYHNDNTRAILFGDYGTGGAINFNIELNTNHQVRFYWNGSPDKNFNSESSIGLQNWAHITLTYDGTQILLYKNGQVISDKYNATLTTKLKNSGSYFLGRDSRTGATAFNGSLNDFRIYDHALSAAEVHEISQGLVLHYKLDSFTNGLNGNNNLAEGSKALNIASSVTNCNISKRGSATTEVRTDGFTQVNCAAAWQGFSLWSNSLNLQVGATYTYSFYGYTKLDTSTNAAISFYPMMYNSAGTRDTTSTLPISVMGGTFTNSNAKQIGKLTTTAQRYWATFTWNQTMADILANGGKIELSIQVHGTFNEGRIDYLWAPKLELGSYPTDWTPSKNELDIITIGTEDSSGYNNNGQIIGDLIIEPNGPRYTQNMKWNSSSPTDNSETGICYIQSPLSLTTPLQMTVAWQSKPDNGYNNTSNHGAFCTSNNTSRPTDYNSTAFHHRDSGFDICPSDGSGVKRLTFTYTKGSWHHHAVTYDGNIAKAYQDGVKTSEITVGTNKTLTSFSQLYIGYSQAGGVRRKTLGNYSDFRVYVTALTADDILQLYHTSAKIDNKQNIYTFEIISNESDTSIKKTGAFYSTNIFEYYIPMMDKNIYTEPDGSLWIHIFHHNNPAGGRFNDSAGDWSFNKIIDSDRWYEIESALFGHYPNYEFLLKQKTTSDATEQKYRWVQTVNPLIATWNDVRATTAYKYNTTSGYSTSSIAGGMYLFKQSNLHMCISNASNGNWYGGLGVSTAYNGGIPGFPNTTVTTGYIDLYLRIYENAKIIENYGISANQIIEF